MFTDGVTEARDAGDEEFGEQRLMECLGANAACPPTVLLGRIFSAVQGFCGQIPQTDDATVTVSRFI